MKSKPDTGDKFGSWTVVTPAQQYETVYENWRQEMRSVAEIIRSYGIVDEHGKHLNGTDKMTAHNYGDAYESLFVVTERYEMGFNKIPLGTANRSIRDEVKLVMEVGVADGSCLLAWREIFPNALIVGMDIHHSDKAHGERIEFHYGDQTNKDHCERAAAGRLFDMIVEDATHKLSNTLLTLFYLWPYVKPGGIYVVEEFEGGSGDKERIRALFPQAEIIGTCGPHIEDEPLIVFRKST